MQIKKGRTTYTDTMDKIHEGKDGITCCGGLMRIAAHIDGTDFYSYQYHCECGNNIEVKVMRSKKDKEFWGE